MHLKELEKNPSTSELLLKNRQSLDLVIPLTGNMLSVDNEFSNLRKYEDQNDDANNNSLHFRMTDSISQQGLPRLPLLHDNGSGISSNLNNNGSFGREPRELSNNGMFASSNNDYDIKIQDAGIMDDLMQYTQNPSMPKVEIEHTHYPPTTGETLPETKILPKTKRGSAIRKRNREPQEAKKYQYLKQEQKSSNQITPTNMPAKSQQDTKNVLRNFGNSQNQYILYNPRCKVRISEVLNRPDQFEAWVRGLRLENFQQFKTVWQGEAGPQVYTHLYKELCWRFYGEEAVCYVLNSRMKNETTRTTHLKYIYRFLEGIKDPACFHYFKKSATV